MSNNTACVYELLVSFESNQAVVGNGELMVKLWVQRRNQDQNQIQS